MRNSEQQVGAGGELAKVACIRKFEAQSKPANEQASSTRFPLHHRSETSKQATHKVESSHGDNDVAIARRFARGRTVDCGAQRAGCARRDQIHNRALPVRAKDKQGIRQAI